MGAPGGGGGIHLRTIRTYTVCHVTFNVGVTVLFLISPIGTFGVYRGSYRLVGGGVQPAIINKMLPTNTD